MQHVWLRGEVHIRVLVGKLEEKSPLGRHRLRWENNINMDLQEVGWGTWTELFWLTTGIGGWLRQLR
jgi:hypothetical protein